MKSTTQTQIMSNRLKEEENRKRRDLLWMFCNIVKNQNGEIKADTFLAHYAGGGDTLRLCILRDMILNDWIHVNDTGEVEVGEKMPSIITEGVE